MDTATFDRIVAEYGTPVLRVCRSILRDEHLGADAAQETFVRLWRHASGGRPPRAPGAWLRKAAVSAALDLSRRRASRERATRQVLDATRVEDLTASRGPEDEASWRELRRRFDAGLTRLPEGQRTVFLLRHEGGLGLREVADLLGVSLETVKTQFARACVRLQAVLGSLAREATEDEETRRRTDR